MSPHPADVRFLLKTDRTDELNGWSLKTTIIPVAAFTHSGCGAWNEATSQFQPAFISISLFRYLFFQMFYRVFFSCCWTKFI